MEKGILRQRPATEQHSGAGLAISTTVFPLHGRLENQEGPRIFPQLGAPAVGENEDGADGEGKDLRFLIAKGQMMESRMGMMVRCQGVHIVVVFALPHMCVCLVAARACVCGVCVCGFVVCGAVYFSKYLIKRIIFFLTKHQVLSWSLAHKMVF